MLGSRPTTATRTARLAAALAFVLAASVLPAAAASVRLMAFGHSLTPGYGLASAATFPEQLEAALWPACLDVTVPHAGNPRDTTPATRRFGTEFLITCNSRW